MDEYFLFEAFEMGDYIPEEQIKKVINYICGQLISWSPNRSYYEEQYNFATKLHIVCRWKRKNGFPALVKKGKVICNDKLVNFFGRKRTQKLYLFKCLNKVY